MQEKSKADKTKDYKKDKNPHAHHRERLRERYRDNGILSMQEHEILEMLLFYSIPVVNTNPVAHALLNEFGSLRNVFEATPDALSQVEGLGEKSALYLSFLGDIFTTISKNNENKKVPMTFNSMGELLVREFEKDKTERVVAVMLDAKDRIICKEHISNGSVTGAHLDMKKIARIALTKDVAKVVIAHNHPDGNPNPSTADKASTMLLSSSENIDSIHSLKYKPQLPYHSDSFHNAAFLQHGAMA